MLLHISEQEHLLKQHKPITQSAAIACIQVPLEML